MEEQTLHSNGEFSILLDINLSPTDTHFPASTWPQTSNVQSGLGHIYHPVWPRVNGTFNAEDGEYLWQG